MQKIWIAATACLAASMVVVNAPHIVSAVADDTSQLTTTDIVKVKSAYPFEETIARLKADVAAKGIMFFSEIDQSGLAASAGIALRPSTLLVFGNPPLGTMFITANPLAGLDWPVRLLVFQDADGQIWTAFTQFDSIARRHHITNREVEFKMASTVIASITSAVAGK